VNYLCLKKQKKHFKMEDAIIDQGQEANQNNFIYCRATDLIKLMRTKEDRINIAKENSKKIFVIIIFRLDDAQFAGL
jgi:hypothetical protein